MHTMLNPAALHPVHYVVKFHEVYEHPIASYPSIPDAKMRLLRCRLLVEEVAEFCRASGFPVETYWSGEPANGVDLTRGPVPFEQVTPDMDQPELVDMVEAADAVGDINVVNNGAALTWGFPIDSIDSAIHQSNMSKLGPDGRPLRDEHGKTLKGPGYKPPTATIRELLRWAGADLKDLPEVNFS